MFCFFGQNLPKWPLSLHNIRFSILLYLSISQWSSNLGPRVPLKSRICRLIVGNRPFSKNRLAITVTGSFQNLRIFSAIENKSFEPKIQVINLYFCPYFDFYYQTKHVQCCSQVEKSGFLTMEPSAQLVSRFTVLTIHGWHVGQINQKAGI